MLAAGPAERLDRRRHPTNFSASSLILVFLTLINAARTRRWTLAHMEEASGLLMLVCTKTGEEINTRALYTRADLERVRNASLMLYCKLCRQTHRFRFADARLKSTGG
jgi:hypothetical protein